MAWDTRPRLSAATSAWAGGLDGKMLRWNGKAWSKAQFPSAVEIYGLAGVTAANVWAVGNITGVINNEGVIYHWNGKTWARS
jgi:hypothetical protein